MNDDTNAGRGSLGGIWRCLSAIIGHRFAETFVRLPARAAAASNRTCGHAAMRHFAARRAPCQSRTTGAPG